MQGYAFVQFEKQEVRQTRILTHTERAIGPVYKICHSAATMSWTFVLCRCYGVQDAEYALKKTHLSNLLGRTITVSFKVCEGAWPAHTPPHPRHTHTHTLTTSAACFLTRMHNLSDRRPACLPKCACLCGCLRVKTANSEMYAFSSTVPLCVCVGVRACACLGRVCSEHESN